MQVCHGKSAPLRRIQSGDRIVYYSPRQRFGARKSQVVIKNATVALHLEAAQGLQRLHAHHARYRLDRTRDLDRTLRSDTAPIASGSIGYWTASLGPACARSLSSLVLRLAISPKNAFCSVSRTARNAGGMSWCAVYCRP
jgi:hypothetical protein